VADPSGVSDVPADVWELARSVPGWAGAELAVAPLEGGITNRNYRVDVGGEAFVLRVPGAETSLLGIDREAEHEAARRAEVAGAGPPVFAFLAERGCLVTRFVAGSHIAEADLEQEPVLAAVVGSIRAIHACPPIRSAFPVFRIVEDYRRVASERGVTIPPAYEAAHALANRIEEAFQRAAIPEVVCHNDLLNANFLRDGDHVWIVDYEYAGMGDPFFDLGNLAVNNGLPSDAQELLLRLYFGAVRDDHRARLALMRIMSDFREAMWGVVQQALSTLDIDYVDYADRHFTRLLDSAADHRFEMWLDVAGAP
jgi:thiamine kinase-like enzyme